MILHIELINSQISFRRSGTYLKAVVRCIYHNESWLRRSNGVTGQSESTFPTGRHDGAKL